MKVVARLILVLIGLFLIGVGLYFLAVSVNLAGGLVGVTLLELLGMPLFVALGAVIVAAGLVLISIGPRPARERKIETVLQTSEYGEIRIAITAIENMVLRVVQQAQGVKDVSRKVTYTSQGLVIFVHIRVMPDLKLPDLAGELQAKVKDYVEEITGFMVHEVKVTVENIIMDQVALKVR